MFKPLADLRIVELAAFVPAPLCGLNLARLGAEVIRIDPIGGGPDANRWPLAPDGTSLYWQGLNKGKKSVALNLSSAEGRELAVALATAGGGEGAALVTNFPASGFTAYETLRSRRNDIIVVRITGWSDGSPATDAVVSATVGVPLMTGRPDEASPVGLPIPAWDLIAANHAAFAFLAAERHRQKTGAGAEVRVALGDVAAAALADLGMVAEVALSAVDRPRQGNQFYGGFGRDFTTADGRRILIMALTRRQWTDLQKALSIGDVVGQLQDRLRVDFITDESARYVHRDALNAIVSRAVSQMSMAQLSAAFDGTAIAWAPFNRLSEAMHAGVLNSGPDPVFTAVTHPGGFTYPTSGSPALFNAGGRNVAASAPVLGQHTDEVLAAVLGLSDAKIGQLHDAGMVAGPSR
jgi:2-methylfumaryl-CoA isomerase